MNWPKILVNLGLFFIALGGLVWIGSRIPGIGKLGRLPGDIRIERENFRVYFPWVSCVVISIMWTLAAYLWRRFKG